MHRQSKLMQIENKRMLDAREGAEYCSMGLHSFRQWAETIGAVRRFGRLVRFDRRVIDNALDEMGAATE